MGSFTWSEDSVCNYFHRVVSRIIARVFDCVCVSWLNFAKFFFCSFLFVYEFYDYRSIAVRIYVISRSPALQQYHYRRYCLHHARLPNVGIRTTSCFTFRLNIFKSTRKRRCARRLLTRTGGTTYGTREKKIQQI